MKSVRYFLFISISLLYVCTFPCEAIAELSQGIEYAVVEVQYDDVTTTYEYDPNGNITRIEAGPNDIILQYDDNGKLVACLGTVKLPVQAREFVLRESFPPEVHRRATRQDQTGDNRRPAAPARDQGLVDESRDRTAHNGIYSG